MKTTDKLLAVDLVQMMHDIFRCGHSPRYDCFRAAYLTTPGQRIVRESQPGMSDESLLAIATRAIAAKYGN